MSENCAACGVNPKYAPGGMALCYICAQAQTIVAGLNILRYEEGNSVEVFCDNPEGPPNNASVCFGEWTHWSSKRFEGESLLDAINKAVEEKLGIGPSAGAGTAQPA